MSKKHFTEQELERMLRDMPAIQDHRSRDEVYHAVKKRMHDNPTVMKRKRFFWPAVASIAATFLIVIISISLIHQKQNGIEEARLPQIHMTEEDKEFDMSTEEAELSMNGESFLAQEKSTPNLNDERTAIYPEMVQGKEIPLTFNVPEPHFQNAIPLSVIARVEEGQTWLDKYQEISVRLDEEALGLIDYFPIQGTFFLEEDGTTLTLNLDRNHPYTAGSASEEMFFRSLEAFRYQDISRVHLLVDSQPGLKLHHEDEPITVYEIAPRKQTGYWLYDTEQHVFLTPGPLSYNTVSEGLMEMKNAIPTHELKPAIPETVDFQVDEESPNTLAIVFSAETVLTDDLETLYMIEAILFTAKEFGYTDVHFLNTGTNNLFGWDFTAPVPVPLAPNRIQLVSD